MHERLARGLGQSRGCREVECCWLQAPVTSMRVHLHTVVLDLKVPSPLQHSPLAQVLRTTAVALATLIPVLGCVSVAVAVATHAALAVNGSRSQPLRPAQKTGSSRPRRSVMRLGTLVGVGHTPCRRAPAQHHEATPGHSPGGSIGLQRARGGARDRRWRAGSQRACDGARHCARTHMQGGLFTNGGQPDWVNDH